MAKTVPPRAKGEDDAGPEADEAWMTLIRSALVSGELGSEAESRFSRVLAPL